MSPDEELQTLRLDHLRRGLAPTTTRMRLRVAQRFAETQGVPFAAATQRHVSAFLAERRRQGLAGTSLALELGNLRAIFRALGVPDPVPRLRILGATPKAPLQLSRPAIQALLKAASLGPGRPEIQLRDRACLEVLYGAGLRVSEAAAIRVPDLCLRTRTLRVRPAKLGPPRTLPLPHAAAAHVRRYLREARWIIAAKDANSADYLLLTREGRPSSGRNVTSIVARVAARAGVRAHAHALRRALATHLAEEGVSLEAIRYLLGHAELETTALYVGVSRAELHKAVQALELRPEGSDEG